VNEEVLAHWELLHQNKKTVFNYIALCERIVTDYILEEKERYIE